MVQTRLLQIGDLIPRVDSMLLEPSFDPHRWREENGLGQP
jgi:hypothetical protein